jgi:hypothetical protein
MSTHKLVLVCRVRTRYYKTGTDGVLSIHAPRTFMDPKFLCPHARIAVCDTDTEIGDPVVSVVTRSVPIRPDSGIVPDHMPLFFNLTMSRAQIGETPMASSPLPAKGSIGTRVARWSGRTREQMYYSHAGAGSCTVRQLLNSKVPIEVHLLDTQSGVIGSVIVGIGGSQAKITSLKFAFMPNYPPFMYGPELDVYTDRVVRAINAQCPIYPRSNIDYYDRYPLDTIQLDIGTVPMCVFPLNLTTVLRAKDRTAESMLLGLMGIALYSMQMTEAELMSDSLPLPKFCELLGQMITAPTRVVLYQADISKRDGVRSVPVDDWQYLGHQRVGERIGFDCEDGTALCVEIARMIQESKVVDRRLLKIQSLAKRYVVLFCVGVIRIQHKEFTYHAFGLMLDRGQVMSRYLAGSGGGTETKSEAAVPTIMLESTNFSAACWQYTDENQSIAEYRAGHLMEPIEASTRVTANVIIERDVYKHIIYAFSPELYHSHKALRFLFGQRHGSSSDGELREAASILDVMNHRSYEVSTAFATGSLDSFRVRDICDCTPFLHSLANTKVDWKTGVTMVYEPSGSGDRSEITRRKPRYNLLYRGIDWDDKTKAVVKELTGAKLMEIATIKLVDGMIGIGVRTWS